MKDERRPQISGDDAEGRGKVIEFPRTNERLPFHVRSKAAPSMPSGGKPRQQFSPYVAHLEQGRRSERRRFLLLKRRQILFAATLAALASSAVTAFLIKLLGGI